MFGNFLHQIKINIVGKNALAGPVKSAIGDLKKLKSSAASMRSVGKGMMFTGAVLGAMMAAPIVSAAQLETGMVGVKKTTGLALAEISAGIGDLVDKKIPTTIEGFNQIAETAGQLGIKGKKDIFEFTEGVAKMTAVSDLAADRAASSFAGFSNVFKIPLAQVENMGSSINELSNRTNASAGYIVDAMQRIGRPIDTLTFQQLAGLSATFADVGLQAEVGGTAFRNVFIRMQTQAGKIAKVMKMSTSDWSKAVQKDGMGSMLALLEAFKKVDSTARGAKIEEIFGERGFMGVQKMVDNIGLLKKNMGVSNDAFAKAISLNEELRSVQESTGGQWTVFMNQVKLFVASVGGPFLSSVNILMAGLGGIARHFRKFAQAHPTIVKVVGAFVLLASFVLLVGGAFLFMAGMMAGAMANLGILSFEAGTATVTFGAFKGVLIATGGAMKTLAASAIKSLVGMLGVLKGAIIALGGALKALFLNPLGIAILVIAALVGAFILLYKHSEGFRNFVDKIGAALKKLTFEKVWNAIKNGFMFVVNILRMVFMPTITFFVAFWTTAWGVVKSYFTMVWKNIVATALAAFSFVKAVATFWIDLFQGMFRVVGALIRGDWAGAWQALKDTFIQAWENIGGVWGIVTGWFSEWIGNCWDAGAGMIAAFADGISSGLGNVKGSIGGVFGKSDAMLPHSDAKEGPFKHLTRSGKSFTKTFSAGIESERSVLESALKSTFGNSLESGLGGGATPNINRQRESRSVTLHIGDIHIHADNADEGIDKLKAKLLKIFKELGMELGGLSVES